MSGRSIPRKDAEFGLRFKNACRYAGLKTPGGAAARTRIPRAETAKLNAPRRSPSWSVSPARSGAIHSQRRRALEVQTTY